jgi:hypothetical protein
MLAVALTAGALVSGPASAQVPPGECPEVMATTDVVDGMVGTGYTVSEGTTPAPFSAEVLGVLENGIGPGRDMIIVDTTSPAIEEAGGIWFGMSGSPVYLNGEFAGAVAYGLSYGPSTIGGLTPAEDMLEVGDRPFGRAASPEKVVLTDELRRKIARATGTKLSRVGSSMGRLMTPLSVSGAGERTMREVARTIEREDLPFVPFAGSSASAAPEPSDDPVVAGGNMAVALSYGDVTYAGIGTVSYVCEDVVLAFGHPFFGYPAGQTALGANHADALTIVDDQIYGPFKLANVTGGIGTVDQDRFAGVRGIMGIYQPTIPVTSHIEVADGLRSRDGASDVMDSEYVPMIALTHALSNVDFTRDEIDEGSAELSWTITGTTASGDPWSLERTNLFSSQYDINYESLFEMEGHLYALLSQTFEDIEFTGVDVNGTYFDSVDQLTLSKVEVSTDGETYSTKRRVRIARGGTVYVRATLEPSGDGDDQVVDLQFEIPRRVKYSGSIEIAGGQSYYFDYYCLIYPQDCGGTTSEIESLEDLIAQFESAPTNDTLRGTVFGGRGNKLLEEVVDFANVVSGYRNIRVIVKNGGGSGSGGGVVPEG